MLTNVDNVWRHNNNTTPTFFSEQKSEKVGGLYSVEGYTPVVTYTASIITFLLIRCFTKRTTWQPDNDLTVNEHQRCALRCLPRIYPSGTRYFTDIVRMQVNDKIKANDSPTCIYYVLREALSYPE